MQVEIYTNDGFKYTVTYENYDAKGFAKELNNPNLSFLQLGNSGENKNSIALIAPISDAIATHELQTHSAPPISITLSEEGVKDAVASLNEQRALFGVVGDVIVNKQAVKRFIEINEEER